MRYEGRLEAGRELGELAGSDHHPAAERERASDALALLAAELMRRTPDGASA